MVARREGSCLGPNISSNIPLQSGIQNTGKLKLQLFPIDDGTKRALEMDKHNPYLELTLSTRKKITSVMEHIHKKWGNCTIACGELMLFPYNTERGNISKGERWTRESFVTATDVYAVIGNPPVFRLRYGWISATELQSTTSATPSGISVVEPTPTSRPGPWSNILDCETPVKDKEASSSHGNAVLGHGGNAPSQRSLTCYGVEKMGVDNNSSISAGAWADSLTNISVGDLLTQVSDVGADCVEAPCTGTSTPFTCDSFDAAIAAHILSHHNKTGFQSAVTSSIWDAEDTCDAFSFQNRSLKRDHAQTLSVPALSPVSEDLIKTSCAGSDSFFEDFHEEEEMVDAAPQEDLVDEDGPSAPNLREASSKDFNSLTNMYWPESLGPLDLDSPSSCRGGYNNSQDITRHLIASSLDAFQNCSFFSAEKKGNSSETEAQEKTSSSGNTTDAGRGSNGD